ncbi:hypothetical protein E2C01_079769 [Portunus trituberculatus]|uniref:Uncharacterized protein n=1 Tax=Portunus trituberculatus TaxID=210409 RepID=A0A5B7IKD7_PORTR|nr:hypothetical protein [Portunus trituberculatus]
MDQSMKEKKQITKWETKTRPQTQTQTRCLTPSYLLVHPRDMLGYAFSLQGIKLVVRARVVVTENLECYLEEEATRTLKYRPISEAWR